jgi:hypothetical protein
MKKERKKRNKCDIIKEEIKNRVKYGIKNEIGV